MQFEINHIIAESYGCVRFLWSVWWVNTALGKDKINIHEGKYKIIINTYMETFFLYLYVCVMYMSIFLGGHIYSYSCGG